MPVLKLLFSLLFSFLIISPALADEIGTGPSYLSFQENLSNQQIQHLRALVEESRKSLRKTKKKLELLERQNAGPKQDVQNRRQEKNSLKQQITIAQDKLEIVLEKGEKFKEEIKTIEEKKKEHLSLRNGEIARLEARYEELNGILSQAWEKLGGESLNISADLQEEERSKDNLGAIKKENKALKLEFSYFKEKLEKAWEELD